MRPERANTVSALNPCQRTCLVTIACSQLSGPHLLTPSVGNDIYECATLRCERHGRSGVLIDVGHDTLVLDGDERRSINGFGSPPV